MVKVAQSPNLDRCPSKILFENEKYYSLSALQTKVTEILDSPADYDLHITYGDRYVFQVQARYSAKLFVRGNWILMEFWTNDTCLATEYQFLKVKDMNVCDEDEIDELMLNALNDITHKRKRWISELLEDEYNEKMAEARDLQDTEDFLRANPY